MKQFAVELRETLLVTRNKADGLQLAIWLVLGALIPWRRKHDPYDPLEYPFCSQEWIGERLGCSRRTILRRMKKMEDVMTQMRHNYKVHRTPIGIHHGDFPKRLNDVYTVLPLLDWVRSDFLKTLTKNKVVTSYLWLLAFRDKRTGEIGEGDFFDNHLDIEGPPDDCYRLVDFLAWALGCSKWTAQRHISKLQELGYLRKEWRNRGVNDFAFWFLDLPEMECPF